MVSAMKAVRSHKRPTRLGHMICLTVMVLLLANPVLAAVAVSMDCTGQCCCCASSGQAPLTTTIGSTIDMDDGCCGPAGSTPCHMSTGTRPDVEQVLVQTAQPSPADAIHLLHANHITVASPPSTRIPASSVDTNPERHPIPLYLKTCRLIC
jgi:hypothetical protein